jgi:hypothetical protein
LRALTNDCMEANTQVESLHQLTSDQNDQLAALKKQTEAAIRSKEETNQEVILISLANTNVRALYNKLLCCATEFTQNSRVGDGDPLPHAHT